MERKKIPIMELDQYEREILEMTFHAESYDAILSEFSGTAFVLGDCLRSLIRKKLLFPLEWEPRSGAWKRRIVYDADRLREYRYQLSALGHSVRKGYDG